MTGSVFVATGNPHKLAEMQKISNLLGVDIDLKSTTALAPGLAEKFNPVEDGETYQQNALIKARALFTLVKAPVLSEDSGLEVEALDQKPGIHSARWGETDRERIEKVQAACKGPGFSMNGRTMLSPASFVACFCFMQTSVDAIYFFGRVNGFLQLEIEEGGGFGYDPVFYFPPAKKTFAAMKEEKMKVSHRFQALQRFLRYFQGL